MRRTDEEFIKEVYRRRSEKLKKKKQTAIILSVTVPFLIVSVFLIPAMLPASSTDKSAAPMGQTSPPENHITTYPPGTVIIHITSEKEKHTYSLDGTDTVNFIREKVWSQNSASSSLHDEAEDRKNTDLGEKICSLSFVTSFDGIKKYSYSLYERGIYDELCESVCFLTEDEITEFKSLLNLD